MPNKLRESVPELVFCLFVSFFIFRPRIEKASWVVYFLHPFFLFMSFSFYEPWVNTAHVNDILTQRAMNNAFEFTFMPESDPSQHPFSLSPRLYFPPCSTPPSFPHTLLTVSPSHLHYSSSSELSLISPLLAPPSFSPPTPPSGSRQETVQDQTGAFRAEHLLYQCFCFSLLFYPGPAQMSHWDMCIIKR